MSQMSTHSLNLFTAVLQICHVLSVEIFGPLNFFMTVLSVLHRVESELCTSKGTDGLTPALPSTVSH